MREKRKFFVLAGIFLVMTLVFISILMVGDVTRTRLIQRKQDEVRAYYTALYFDSTGKDNAIALDNGVGYVTFNLMNFIGEDVTERDIAYEIRTPSSYYTSTNQLISTSYLGSNLSTIYFGADNTLNVRDVWEQPTPIGRDTYRYTVKVESNTAELYHDVYPTEPELGTASTDYLFKYEKLDNNGSANAVGKTHNVTLQLTRTENTKINGTENISIVIQLYKPYKEVFIINMTVSERLIVFSKTSTVDFETKIEELNIQTVDIFSHLSTKTGDAYNKRTFSYTDNDVTVKKGFAAKPLKVTLNWTGLIINEVLLNNIPDNVLDKSQLANLQSDSGSIVLMIPQSSSFKLQFLPTSTSYSVTAKVEIIDAYYEKDSNGNEVYTETDDYVLYDKNFGGYTDSEIVQNENTEILVLNQNNSGLVH